MSGAVSFPVERGLHPLFKLAVVSGSDQLVRLHIARGRDVNAKDETGTCNRLDQKLLQNFGVLFHQEPGHIVAAMEGRCVTAWRGDWMTISKSVVPSASNAERASGKRVKSTASRSEP